MTREAKHGLHADWRPSEAGGEGSSGECLPGTHCELLGTVKTREEVTSELGRTAEERRQRGVCTQVPGGQDPEGTAVSNIKPSLLGWERRKRAEGRGREAAAGSLQRWMDGGELGKKNPDLHVGGHGESLCETILRNTDVLYFPYRFLYH